MVVLGIFEVKKWDNPMIRVMGYILLIHMSIYEYETVRESCENSFEQSDDVFGSFSNVCDVRKSKT